MIYMLCTQMVPPIKIQNMKTCTSRVFAIADLHGRYDLWTKVREFLQPDDMLYILGDCADRGPDGYKIIKEILENKNKQYIYLKGNHEDLFTQAIEGDPMLHFYNGGQKTYNDWLEDREPLYILHKLKSLPIVAKYENTMNAKIILTHAGFTPNKDNILPKEDLLLWDRNHISDIVEGIDDYVVVHGHTPIDHMSRYMNQKDKEVIFADKNNFLCTRAVRYCYDEEWLFPHKICIDCGSAWTGKTILFDLDTFEEHLIEV